MYDLTVIGAGPGGYAAAVRARELGAKACIVEKDLLGGVCLNRGCIPTKTIIKSLDILREIKRASEFGIDISGYKVDIAKIQKRKEEIILKLRQGLEALLESKGIDIIKGQALISDTNTIKVDGKSINSKHILIAAGSAPVEREGLKFDHNYIFSTDDILQLDRAFKSLVIIGGGVVGCEFAAIYNRLGCEVTIIEVLDQLLPQEDKEIARRLEASFKKSGIKVIKSAKVVSADAKDGVNPVRNIVSKGDGEISNRVKVNLSNGTLVEAEAALLCIGRRANISGLNLDKVGISTDNGRIQVDEKLRTSIPNIYAAGDAIGGYLLAHVASYEGTVASENMFGKPRSADYSCVPNCIFTCPQISSIGLTEDKARERDINFLVTRLPFAAVSAAHIFGETAGLIKLISDAKTDQVLGAHIFGAGASELISEFAIAMKNKTTTGELAEVIFPHPTLSEGILEAAHRMRQPHLKV